MQNRNLKLPFIDYNDPDFSARSYDALHKYGAFILANAPTAAADSVTLMKEFRDFAALPADAVKPFLAGEGVYDLGGYHPYEQHWASRRFSGCFTLVSDGAGKIAQSFPTEHFKKSAGDFTSHAREIADKVLNVIGTQLNIQQALADYFKGYSILGIVDSYVPATREKINSLKACGKLLITDDHRLEAFAPHCDLNPLTIIAYDNNDCSGLEMQLPDESGKLSYVPIELPKTAAGQVTPLVLVGEPLETLTGGVLRAPRHRVVLEPMKSGDEFHRGLTSAFTLFGPHSKEPKPLVSSDANSPSNNDFDAKGYFTAKYERHKEQLRKENSGALAPGLLEGFPAEAEIEKVQSVVFGAMYIRR